MAGKALPYQDKKPELAAVAFTLALVFACFTLTSTSYLAWLYQLIDFAPTVSADAVTMVGGYSFQALGIGFMCALMRVNRRTCGRMAFVTALAIHFAVATATMLASSPESLMALGFAMNFLCGIVCAFYLQRLAQLVPHRHRGLAFSGGYACSVFATWALSAIQNGNSPSATESIVVCAALSLAAIGMIAVSHNIASRRESSTVKSPDMSNALATVQTTSANEDNSGSTAYAAADLLPLACVTVVLMSLVKNVGFGFPPADLVDGVSLETSRLFYAAGLLSAGLVADANRKYAALCCLAALVLPFGFLALASEPIPGTILWAVNYLFYGFFSVYRVVLLCDIAEDAGHEYLAGFGLLFGRIGDALGTALWLALGTSLVGLVAVACVLYAATVFAFYHLLLRLYPTRHAQQKSREERFEEFAATYSVSVREREVLRLVLAERTNAEIASQLFITEGTVKYHVHNLLKKTGCASRRELIERFNIQGATKQNHPF